MGCVCVWFGMRLQWTDCMYILEHFGTVWLVYVAWIVYRVCGLGRVSLCKVFEILVMWHVQGVCVGTHPPWLTMVRHLRMVFVSYIMNKGVCGLEHEHSGLMTVVK